MPVDNDALDRLRRLRALGVRRGARDLPRPQRPPGALPGNSPGLSGPMEEAGNTVPGAEVDTPYGPAWARTARYPLAERPDLAALLAVPPAALAALAREPALLGWDPAGAVFVDTETTGLSIGTDTYTFLIGVGRYEDGCFVVRQLFMRHPGEERAQLHLAEELLGAGSAVVTFNGRAFDMPLIQNRFILARIPPPLAGAPNLDLVPPARRLYRAHHGSCALGELERNVLGLQRSAADVPGWLIPSIYRDYYRGGANAEMMARVFYHNLQDIASMALLAAGMARLFETPFLLERLAELHPLECTSLARCYEALEWTEAGIAAYRTALANPLPDGERAQVLRDLGFMLKRLGRRDEAAALWEEWISSVPDAGLTPYIELAKHHEWVTGELATARSWTAWAIHIAEGEASRGAGLDAEPLAELRHRLARLERKLAGKEG